MDSSRNSVRRFDDRAEDYVRGRPGYPAEVVALLERQGLPPAASVADIGSGTGKLSERFVEAGHRVIGIEPNDAMRAAAQGQLGGQELFRQQAGTAEATGLPDASVDAVVAAQAFHWFEPRAARAEFVRILRPAGLVALVWNDRRMVGCPLLAEYDELLSRHCPEYEESLRRSPMEPELAAFFAPGVMTEERFDNSQRLDWAGYRTRALSASYVQREGPAHEAFFAALRESFDRHATVDRREGAGAAPRADLLYDTRVFWGRLPPR
jgi:SAM-dependent methyltransferase